MFAFQTINFPKTPSVIRQLMALLTNILANGYLCAREERVKDCKSQIMFKKIRELYKEYKPYVRVDLIMYGVLILMIFLYLIISTLVD